MQWQLTPGSSNVAAFAYDPDAKILRVRFNSGHEYAYAGVPPEVHDSMLNADSVGSFLHENVKGQYDYRRTG